MNNVREFIKKFNTLEVILNAPLKSRTTFLVGGEAQCLLLPSTVRELQEILKELKGEDFFILGGGANLVISDEGVREPVISLEKLNKMDINHNEIRCEAGASVESLCLQAEEKSLGGIEFLWKLPGTVGGAVRMNARCYDKSICEVLKSVDFLEKDGSLSTWTPQEGGFDYKISPFQDNGRVVTAATFSLYKTSSAEIKAKMQACESDRTQKGHFRFPCAGSIFKNDRRFGKPSGQLIDEAGLRGLTLGGAQVAPFHGNIIINKGEASATDIKNLIEEVQKKVKAFSGFHLEPEVVFVGEWPPTS